MNQRKQEVLSKLADRNTAFAEKVSLLAELEQMDAESRNQVQAEKDLDWANMTVKARLEPVMAYDRHTTESDWLDSFTASDHSPHEIYAEGAMWYSNLDDDVRADAEEYIIQAKGRAQHIAGAFGDKSEAAEQEFMEYVAFLNREVLAASGLDQVGQEYDAKDEYKPTPLPTEVFDNFAPATNEYATTVPRGSDQAPSMREMSQGQGQETGRPSQHDTSDVKLNDAPHENESSQKTSSLEGDDSLDFSFGSVMLPSVSAADSRGTSWWKSFRDRMKSRPKGKHRQEKGKHREDGSSSKAEPKGQSQPRKPDHTPAQSNPPSRHQEVNAPGKHRRPEDQPSRGQHAGEQTYKPKHRKGTEPPKPGKRRKDPSGGSDPHRPERGQGSPSGDRRHRTQPSRNQKPQTINHGDSSPGKHRSSDPLTDPHHKVKDTGTPIHDRAQRAKDPTPTHDKVKNDRATDDHIRRELDRRQKGEPSSVREIKNPGDRKNMTQEKHKPTFKSAEHKTSLFSFVDLNPSEAASTLDQVQQRVDSFENDDPKPMPEEVAFPMREDWKEESTSNNERKAMLEMAQKLAAQAEALIKQADMWGNSDSPRPTPGPQVENSPHTTPNEGKGQSYADGYDQGVRDKMIDDAPTFSDASSGAPDYVRGYSKGYSEEEGPTRPKNVPSSLGGDNGQAINSDRVQRRKEMPLSMGSFQASSSFATEEALQSADFRKGYAYARKWTPEVPLVTVGSREFEAGLYAGMTDNPEHQRDFVTANLDHDQLHPRVAAHREFTQSMWSNDDSLTVKGSYVQAATTTDRDFNSPTVSPDPWGATPQQGPGNPPPHAGMEDPARPGGPAPYNGAEPFGQPVVSNPVVGPTKEENARLANFKSIVQANVARLKEGNDQ